MNTNMTYAVVHGTDTGAGNGSGVAWLAVLGLGFVVVFLLWMLLRVALERPTIYAMQGASSDYVAGLGLVVFISLVVAILVVLGLRGVFT